MLSLNVIQAALWASIIIIFIFFSSLIFHCFLHEFTIARVSSLLSAFVLFLTCLPTSSLSTGALSSQNIRMPPPTHFLHLFDQTPAKRKRARKGNLVNFLSRSSFRFLQRSGARDSSPALWLQPEAGSRFSCWVVHRLLFIARASSKEQFAVMGTSIVGSAGDGRQSRREGGREKDKRKRRKIQIDSQSSCGTMPMNEMEKMVNLWVQNRRRQEKKRRYIGVRLKRTGSHQLVFFLPTCWACDDYQVSHLNIFSRLARRGQVIGESLAFHQGRKKEFEDLLRSCLSGEPKKEKGTHAFVFTDVEFKFEAALRERLRRNSTDKSVVTS